MQKIRENKGFKERDKRFRKKGGEICTKIESLENAKLGMKENSKEAGITLIALIVTIIVLLILARSFNIGFNTETMGFCSKLQMQRKHLMLQANLNV